MKDVATIHQNPERTTLTATDIKANVQLVQSVLSEVMLKDTHYGMIPGTQKNTLFKAGSEVILSTFRISVEPEVIDLSGEDEIRYLVKAKGVHFPTGNVVGFGVGECSTNEDKYKWRKAVSDAEFEATDESRKRIKYGRDYNVNQVRTNPADLANTALKMAKKRAQIDLTLTATAASDLFTQDMEDGNNDATLNEYQKPAVVQPQAQGDGTLVTEGQSKLLYAKCANSEKSPEDFFAKFGIKDYKELPKSKVNEALEFLG